MELGKQIKNYRQIKGISQEELANRVYVSRQTISNWENDKSYPDVNSLLLLSEVFQVSLDELIKGDIDIMKNIINQEEVSKFNHYSKIYSFLLIIVIISAVPLFIWLDYWGFIIWGIICAIAMYYAFSIEKIKKYNNVQTYKEILAFSEGKLLDEIQKQREIGKRPYQKVLIIILSIILAIVGDLLIYILFK